MIEEPRNLLFKINSPKIDQDKKKLNYKESITLAHKAVSLDLSDSHSWCTLILFILNVK
jgi:hypothetical protein